MKVSTTFYLNDKRLMLSDGSYIDIYGLSDMRVAPEGIGIGRMMLSTIVRLADDVGKFAVVGFADDFVVDFYKKCGWWVGDDYLCPNGVVLKHIVSSKPLPSNLVIDVVRMW